MKFHKKEGRIATVTAVRPPARFGGLTLKGSRIVKFQEKPQLGEGWINGGYFVFEPEIFDYIANDEIILERDPLEKLVKDNQLVAYRHNEFWQCMDTIRDVSALNALWDQGMPPWKIWK